MTFHFLMHCMLLRASSSSTTATTTVGKERNSRDCPTAASAAHAIAQGKIADARGKEFPPLSTRKGLFSPSTDPACPRMFGGASLRCLDSHSVPADEADENAILLLRSERPTDRPSFKPLQKKLRAAKETHARFPDPRSDRGEDVRDMYRPSDTETFKEKDAKIIKTFLVA